MPHSLPLPPQQQGLYDSQLLPAVDMLETRSKDGTIVVILSGVDALQVRVHNFTSSSVSRSGTDSCAGAVSLASELASPSISFFTISFESFDTASLTISLAALPPAWSITNRANIAKANSEANAARPPDSNQLGTSDRAPAPASPAATNSVSATSPTPATLSPAEDNIASVVASPSSKSSVPDMAFVIADVVVDPSARIEVLDNDEVVVSNAALIPADPSNDEDPISLAIIVPAPPATVVTDVVVARDDAIVPKAVAPLATPLPADVVAAVDAAVLAELAAVVAVVAVVVVDDAAIPDAAVPPIAAERAAAIDPPDVAAILPPESAAVVVVVVEVVVAAVVAALVAVAVDAAIPPPSLRATAPPTAAAVVPTTPAAVLVLLVVLTDAKKKGDSGSSTLSLSLFCCFFFADRNEEFKLLLHLEDGIVLRNAADFDIHEYAANKRR